MWGEGISKTSKICFLNIVLEIIQLTRSLKISHIMKRKINKIFIILLTPIKSPERNNYPASKEAQVFMVDKELESEWKKRLYASRNLLFPKSQWELDNSFLNVYKNHIFLLALCFLVRYNHLKAHLATTSRILFSLICLSNLIENKLLLPWK